MGYRGELGRILKNERDKYRNLSYSEIEDCVYAPPGYEKLIDLQCKWLNSNEMESFYDSEAYCEAS